MHTRAHMFLFGEKRKMRDFDVCSNVLTAEEKLKPFGDRRKRKLKLILIAAAWIIIPGIVALVIVTNVKNKNKKREEAERQNEAVMPSPPVQKPIPEAVEHSRRERTMMLTYTTLILKDKDRPVKMYKSELFRPVYIGRGSENRIRLNDESVSRSHLKVYRQNGLVYAENLSHVNGTKINGRYLTEPKEIVSGDFLELGRMRFLVEID